MVDVPILGGPDIVISPGRRRTGTSPEPGISPHPAQASSRARIVQQHEMKREKVQPLGQLRSGEFDLTGAAGSGHLYRAQNRGAYATGRVSGSTGISSASGNPRRPPRHKANAPPPMSDVDARLHWDPDSAGLVAAANPSYLPPGRRMVVPGELAKPSVAAVFDVTLKPGWKVRVGPPSNAEPVYVPAPKSPREKLLAQDPLTRLYCRAADAGRRQHARAAPAGRQLWPKPKRQRGAAAGRRGRA